MKKLHAEKWSDASRYGLFSKRKCYLVSVTSTETNEPQRHCAKSSMAITKGQVWSDSTLCDTQ